MLLLLVIQLFVCFDLLEDINNMKKNSFSLVRLVEYGEVA